MFNHEALECQVMRILAHITEAVQQGLFLGIEVFAIGGGFYLNDVDHFITFIVDVDITAVDMAVKFIFEEFLSAHII